MPPSGIAFDAFGTLFDLDGLRPRLETAVGAGADDVHSAFVARLVPWTWHATAAGRYRPFPEVAALALEAAGAEVGVELSGAAAREAAKGLTALPPHPGVAEALDELAADGNRLAVLSNGTADGVRALVEGAGLADRFEALLAADEAGAFKPAPEVYRMGAEAFDAPPGEVMLVTAHLWDVAGARQAGLRVAWLRRGTALAPVLDERPDVVVEELSELAGALRNAP